MGPISAGCDVRLAQRGERHIAAIWGDPCDVFLSALPLNAAVSATIRARIANELRAA
jgi:hypothetical protein